MKIIEFGYIEFGHIVGSQWLPAIDPSVEPNLVKIQYADTSFIADITNWTWYATFYVDNVIIYYNNYKISESAITAIRQAIRGLGD